MIEIIITISLFCVGLRSITDPGKVMDFVRNFVKEKLPIYIGKPICLCAPCMSSLWGTVIYWVFYGSSIQDIPEWILVTIAASYVNWFLWELLIKISK